MRLILAAAAACTAAALSGCGEGEAAFRDSYRTQSITSCAQGMRAGSAMAPPGLDLDRICECSVDRYMETRTVAQLRSEENSTTPPPEARRAIEQCLAEQMGGTAAAAADEAAPPP